MPVEQVVARTDQVAVYLSSFSVYPNGFEFEVFAVAGDEESELDPSGFHDLHSETTSPERLRLGFEFSDGSKVTNIGREFDVDWEADDSRPASPVMSGVRGQGGEGQWSRTFWVWPLLPPGSLAFVCEWPAAGIPLTRVELDAESIIGAASRAQRLFGTD